MKGGGDKAGSLHRTNDIPHQELLVPLSFLSVVWEEDQSETPIPANNNQELWLLGAIDRGVSHKHIPYLHREPARLSVPDIYRLLGPQNLLSQTMAHLPCPDLLCSLRLRSQSPPPPTRFLSCQPLHPFVRCGSPTRPCFHLHTRHRTSPPPLEVSKHKHPAPRTKIPHTCGITNPDISVQETEASTTTHFS